MTGGNTVNGLFTGDTLLVSTVVGVWSASWCGLECCESVSEDPPSVHG